MKQLSILIPARNEEFLNLTIADILKNKRGETEIIVGLDGAWPAQPIENHPDVKMFFSPTPLGQRAMTNQLARLSQAKYVMKLDAHCAFDEGFDTKLMADMQDDWTVVPMQYNLHVFDWVCEDGHRRYMSPSGPCDECDKETKKEIVWKRRNRLTWAWHFDKALHFQYTGHAHRTPPENPAIVESMSLLGACWMLTRERYWALDICDEAHGSWGQQGTEVACKTWLSGGKLMVNQKTWFAHMFRTQGGDFGFPYPLSQKEIDASRVYSRELFEGGRFKGVHSLEWLVKRFSPPGW